MPRRTKNGIAAKARLLAAFVGAALLLAPAAGRAETPAKTLRFIPRADLRSIDPIVVPTAYRKHLDGVIVAPVVFLWNIDKR